MLALFYLTENFESEAMLLPYNGTEITDIIIDECLFFQNYVTSLRTSC